MKKTILNLGKSLSKAQQKEINGGMGFAFCDANGECPSGTYCDGYICIKDDSSGGPGNGDDPTCINPKVFCIDEFDTCCLF